MEGWTGPMTMERGVHKDTPGDNWGDLNTDMGAWKDTDIFGK